MVDRPQDVRLLTPAEVALILRVSRATVSRYCKRGLLDAVETPGGRRRIPEAAVLRILNADQEEEGP